MNGVYYFVTGGGGGEHRDMHWRNNIVFAMVKSDSQLYRNR